ncbi:FHA domain-containing protein [Nocardioides panacisoli]|uniref:FHA domain-containing protein n=1 Tax=Nocardioides panacisoli TaxID=627624 RepID=UPI001C62EE20|nr:FHA domain-containing protein [Nocardioides panacisoli]QYJ05603.1 FHA domain-containing protein [Nocardioides panacisoli]
MNAWYAPGERAVAVGPRAVVMAAGERAADLAALAEGAATPLGVLSALSGGDVARLPEFAAVVVDGEEYVVMVRGQYRIERGEEAWSGGDVATWREHRVAAGDTDFVVVAAESAVEDTTLPLDGGVVLAARVAWHAGAPATSADAVAAPVPPLAAPDAAAAPGPAPAPAPPAEPDPEFTLSEEDSFDEVVGATIQGQRAPEPPPAPPAPEQPAGDHDGRTITAAQLQELREQSAPSGPGAVGPRASATLMMSDGEAVELTQPVVIGRSPRADRMSSTQLPRLVVVDDPYVSGTHLEVAVEDDAVVAIDRSTNGTTLTRPGREPQRLTRDEPTVLGDGCVLGLSDDVTATLAVRGADT